jgi:hypothetical protein
MKLIKTSDWTFITKELARLAKLEKDLEAQKKITRQATIDSQALYDTRLEEYSGLLTRYRKLQEDHTALLGEYGMLVQDLEKAKSATIPARPKPPVRTKKGHVNEDMETFKA